MVKFLLDRGSNIDQKDKDGEFVFSIHLCMSIAINLLFINVKICHYI